MADINELTAKLKAAAIYEQLHTFMAVKPGEILEMTEALEAAEKRIAELELELSRYSMSAGEADQRRCESRAVREALGFGKDADDVAPIDLLNRIAELEARTLTVKLPDGCEHDVMAPVAAFMYEDCYEFDQEDYTAVAVRVRSELETVLRRALRAAGIKLQIEGE